MCLLRRFFPFILGLLAGAALAASSINPTNRYAYAANAGWIDCRGDITNGAVVGQYYCSGYLYGANIGWIRLGDGSPDNGYEYSNSSATDYGVNHDGAGNLRGYAWGANVGWINFEDNGAPTVDLLTGRLGGYCYGANMAWISLSNAQAHVQVDYLDTGRDSDADGIPDPWEYKHAGDTGTLQRATDYDGDRVDDDSEYGADTDPMDIGDYLHILLASETGGTNVDLTWASKPTRFYRIEKGLSVTNGAGWADSGLGLIPPAPGTNTSETAVDDMAPTQRFFRVKAVVPLSP